MCKPRSSILRMYIFLILLSIWNVAKADECQWQELDDECPKYCWITLKPALFNLISTEKQLEEFKTLQLNTSIQLTTNLALTKLLENQLGLKETQVKQVEQNVEACVSRVRTTEKSLQEQRNRTEKCQNEKIQLSEELASTKSLQNQLVARSSLENVESKLRNMENQLRQVEGTVETCRASIKSTEATLMQQRTLKEECQNERRKFKKIGQKYYHIENNEKLTWLSALQRCAEWGGHLVHLKSDEEWNLVKKKLENGYRYWVDLNDLETENTFISATSGEKEEFVKWHSGEPNNINKKEHCVELGRFDGFDMNDFYCFEKKNFICESSNERVFNYN